MESYPLPFLLSRIIMKLSLFLENLEKDVPKIVHFCAIHMLEKDFSVEKDSLKESQIKEFFTDYNHYEKYLNDCAGIIYNKFDSSIDEIYTLLCQYFNENPDNLSLFEYRLSKIGNQDPKHYLSMEDTELRNNAIARLENKINIIENSFYYNHSQHHAKETIQTLKQSLSLVKKAVGIS